MDQAIPAIVLELQRLIVSVLNAAVLFAVAPLLMGVVGKTRARLLGRPGPVLWQPYRDLQKLLRKTPVLPDTATDYYHVWPYAAFAATATAALLVPGFALGMATEKISDLITLIGLLALARAATMLAGLETGFGFGGAGAGRDALFSLFTEAAMLLLVLTFLLVAHQSSIDGIATVFRDGRIGVSVSLGFALAAIFCVALTETGRIPADNPAGHLELGMVHEAMLLEYSGKYLALFHYTAMLRLALWFTLLGTIFCPFGMGNAADVFSWPLGMVLWFVKLFAAAVALPFFEVSTAKMRVFRVPEFLGVALLLGLLSGVFLFVAARLGG
jgi:formate hydrogenlyase subunit 4